MFQKPKANVQKSMILHNKWKNGNMEILNLEHYKIQSFGILKVCKKEQSQTFSNFKNNHFRRCKRIKDEMLNSLFPNFFFSTLKS